MPAANTPVDDYARIERAIRYLDDHGGERPSLGDVARHVGLSESHFQRMFTRWAGISPKRFLQHRTAQVVKQLLREGRSTLDTSYEAGLSGPSRLHDLMVNMEAVTPGEYRGDGRGLVIRFGFRPSPFGEALIALTPRGICHLAFVDRGERGSATNRLREDWPSAEFIPDERATRAVAAQVFPALAAPPVRGLSLHLKGTNFQLKVWEALLQLPEGSVTTYGDIATRIGDPKAARAVGTAVGRNPVSWIIPCHRVIRSTGQIGQYAWGADRKRVMLALETTIRPRARRPATPRDALPASAYGAPPSRSA